MKQSDFENIDKFGRGVRFGFVIAVSDGRGGKKPWSDEVFQTTAAARSTAMSCLQSGYEILPAREIIHFGSDPKSHRYRRSVLIGDLIGDPHCLLVRYSRCAWLSTDGESD